MSVTAISPTASRLTKITAMKGLLAKYKGRLLLERDDPDDAEKWRALVERCKRLTVIKDAYAAAGVELRRRPVDAGHDHHPERRE